MSDRHATGRPDETNGGRKAATAASVPTSRRGSPTHTRRPTESRGMSVNELRARTHPNLTMTSMPTETTSLLTRSATLPYSRTTPASPPGPPHGGQPHVLSRAASTIGSLRAQRRQASVGSLPSRWMRSSGLRTPKLHQPTLNLDDRVWYDQFTSTDWVHDSIQDGHRVLQLRRQKGIRGKLRVWADSAQGWILVAIIGCLTAATAYFVDVTEAAIFDLKRGFCRGAWYHGRSTCCNGEPHCDRWRSWSQLIRPGAEDTVWIDFVAFNIGVITMALLACFITLFSKTVVPSHVASTLDENLGAVHQSLDSDDKDSDAVSSSQALPANIYYSAAGSGVAEVKVILSGFVLHGYLGLRTLCLKTFGLILSVSSGMSLGKEGPYVHIATCIGNVACRMFAKYNLNDGKRREVLSASAASGVTVAFGSPLGGVLFSLEEVSYYFPPKTLFRTFFCCIAAALSLKFFNPYGTSKIVLFQVRYFSDWHLFELGSFAFLGLTGGLMGALFIKASRIWATTFRRIPLIKNHPMVEVLLVATTTGLLSFWNRFTRIPVAELLYELAAPCRASSDTRLCPTPDGLPGVIWYLTVAFIIKSFLTTITFGIKVPAGIYVPSMVVGGLMGRIVGHISQYVILQNPHVSIWSSCVSDGGIESCVTPGVYALVAAGATMVGVTRLTVTLAVILFELTGSLDHVLPFSLAILCAKWTSDAVEPHSIYSLLTDMNSYPFLENRASPVFDSELGDITPSPRLDRIIDITISPLVRASELWAKLDGLQRSGELDGGLPIIRDHVLVGLIPAPDLEFALDQVVNHETALCRMAVLDHSYSARPRFRRVFDHDVSESDYDSDTDANEEDDDLTFCSQEPADFTPYIDNAPVALDMHSPMDLVYQCFVKLGLRYICVLEEGKFRGMVHKKAFVRYCKTMEHDQGIGGFY
ncbi:hypothetical protein DV737_g5724, partial [Chaetothyriales sp. CBS 132003]